MISLVALILAATVATQPAAAQVGVIDQYVPPGHQANAPPSHGGHHGEGVAASQGSLVPGGGVSGGGSPPSGGATAAHIATESGASSPASDPGPAERGGGSIPLTDYPVTPLIWVLIAIGAVALIGSAVATRRRRARKSTHAAA